ncbi:hypothetical protein HD806DRAFT_527205 [Xylariaceae sp. AK1471]|nr:hypothetical protein HD806DRAFT_527205 [Xylariaceae sp. AK1471]
MQHHGKLTPTQCAKILIGKKTRFDQKSLKICHSIAKHIAKHDIHRILTQLITKNAFKEEKIINCSSGISMQYLRFATTSKLNNNQNKDGKVSRYFRKSTKL